jgi:uncharacterized lipoprotein
MYCKQYSILTLFLLLVIYGCANTASVADSQGSYALGGERSSNNLAVPPTLNQPQLNAQYVMNNSQQQYLLTDLANMKLNKSGSQIWLEINGQDVNQVWNNMQNFLQQNGINVALQNKATGLIQTQWLSRNTAVPQNGVRSFFSWVGWGSMYSLSSQYMYRINLWQDHDNTLVFITDYQMNEVYPGCVSNTAINSNARIHSSDNQVTKWIPVLSNPQIELNFLAEYMVFISHISPQQTKDIIKQVNQQHKNVTLINNNTIVINDNLNNTWYRSALALERSGLGISSHDEINHSYKVYPINFDRHQELFADPKVSQLLPPDQYIIKINSLSAMQTTLNITALNQQPNTDDNLQQYLNTIITQFE